MSIFSWLFGSSRSAPARRSGENWLRGDGSLRLNIVGKSRYQDALETICGGRTEHGAEHIVTAALLPEDDNPYDKHAVRIEIDGRTVGYLSRENARLYRKRMAAIVKNGVPVYCRAHRRGGWQRASGDQGHFGVFLNVDL